jgi:hypothetical protein
LASREIFFIAKLMVQMQSILCSQVTAGFWCQQFLHATVVFFIVHEMKIGSLRDETDVAGAVGEVKR